MSPFVGTLLNVELSIGVRVYDWRRIAADATGAVVGFSVFFAIESGWSQTLQFLSLQPFNLEVWHLLLAADSSPSSWVASSKRECRGAIPLLHPVETVRYRREGGSLLNDGTGSSGGA